MDAKKEGPGCKLVPHPRTRAPPLLLVARSGEHYSRCVPLPASSLATRHYGPLSSAVAPLGEPASPRAVGGDAASLLGRLLDLRGSVELAALLDRDPIAAGDASSEPHAFAETRQELVEELGEVRAQLAYAFSRWTAQSSKVAGPEVLAAALATRLALGPRERRTSTIAAAVWGPIADEARKELAIARSTMRRLRRDIEPDLTCMGTRAARLCALDRALADAMETAVCSQLARLMSATEAHLVKELALEIATLGASDSGRVIDAWLSPGGAIKRGLALLSRIVHAAVESEERRLLALVDALGSMLSQSESGELDCT